MKKKRYIILWVLLILLAAGIIYNIYDNGRAYQTGRFGRYYQRNGGRKFTPIRQSAVGGV